MIFSFSTFFHFLLFLFLHFSPLSFPRDSSPSVCFMSFFFFSTFLSSPSSSLPLIHPSLNFLENSRRTNTLSFLKVNLILPLSVTCHFKPHPLFIHFVPLSPCLHLSPHLPFVSSNCLHVSQSPVYVPGHTCHCLSLFSCSVSFPFTHYSCSSFLHSLAVTWHRLIQGEG